MRGLSREALFASRRAGRLTQIGNPVQVLVRDNNIDQALRALKKKMQREGVFREMRQRRAYEKPSERRTREKAEAVRRARKLARKQAQREGLVPMPTRKARPEKPRPAQFPAATGTS
jgi:small subunit ribosomal protein S21